MTFCSTLTGSAMNHQCAMLKKCCARMACGRCVAQTKIEKHEKLMKQYDCVSYAVNRFLELIMRGVRQ